MEINPTFVTKSRKLYPYATIIQQDFLDFVPPHKNQGYDCIIGNPPYVKIQNMADADVRKMHEEYPTLVKGNTNMYIYFLLKCMDSLNDDGELIFLIPNTLFYNASLRPVLQKLRTEKQIKRVIDFRDEQIFVAFSTYTCIVHLTKKPNAQPYYLYRIDPTGNDVKIQFITKNNYTSECPFRARIGLMTLLDDVFILRKWTYSKDQKTVSFYQNGSEHTIETAACKSIMKISKNQKHLIIYPYIIHDGSVKIDANFHANYPLAFDYLKSKKTELDNRDSGNVSRYPEWYAYGRTQSIMPNKPRRLFLSSIIRGNMPIKAQTILAASDLYYSGLWLEPKDKNTTIAQILEWHHDNNSAILQNSNMRAGGWYAMTQSSFSA